MNRLASFIHLKLGANSIQAEMSWRKQYELLYNLLKVLSTAWKKFGG